MGCNSRTFYVSGYQITLADLTGATIDGRAVEPAAILKHKHKGQPFLVNLTSRFGTVEVLVNPAQMHGRQGRTLKTSPAPPPLAALGLMTLVRHGAVTESARYARRAAAAAIKAVDDESLRQILETDGAPAALAGYAPGLLTLRLLRSPAIASSETINELVILLPDNQLVHLLRRNELATYKQETDPVAEFELNVRNGLRPEPKNSVQVAVLCAADPEIARKYRDDPNPWIRSTTLRHRETPELENVMLNDTSDLVVRVAAAEICKRRGLPLVTEGRIKGTKTPSTARPEVIFVDVDGCIASGEDIDTKTRAELHRAQESGVIVVAVTTRTVASLAALNLGIDLVTCNGTMLDTRSATILGKVSDKGEAVERWCSLLGTTSCAAIGDGKVDIPMFEKVRNFGGRTAWPADGQSVLAPYATDLVGPVGSGGVGRFVADLLAGNERRVVAPVTGKEHPRQNYVSRIVPQQEFDIHAKELTPAGWKPGHGHVTLAYPSRDNPQETLPTPASAADVRIVGKVQTDIALALVLTVDGATHQANGTPYHLTVATAPKREGGHHPPFVAGIAAKEALETGTVEPITPARALSTVAAPKGTPLGRLDPRVENAAVDTIDAATLHRLGRGLGDETLLRAVAQGGDLTVEQVIETARQQGTKLVGGLIVLSGPPASGKTTFAKQLAKTADVAIISLDDTREEVSGDSRVQADLPTVLEVAKARTMTELALGRTVVHDATNVEAKVLRQYGEMARAAGVPVVAVKLSTDRSELLARDRQRHLDGERSVGDVPGENGTWTYSADRAERVIEKMLRRLNDAGNLEDPGSHGIDATLTPRQALDLLTGGDQAVG